MPTSRDWRRRPVPVAATPQRLAVMVDRALDRTEGLLFTATPAQELDGIGRWQQLKDQAFAGLMREIVAAVNRAGAAEREFAAAEVGLAIGATTTTGATLVAQALALAELPGLLEAVEGGTLTERHVLAVLRELDRVALTLEQRQSVVLVALARYRGQAPGELAAVVGRLVVQVDRAAAEARDAAATARRRVWFSRDVDGQAVLLARGPAAAIAAVRAALEATLPVAADPGDDRSTPAREFDLLVDLLTGGVTAGTWHAEVVVPFATADGGDLELAEIPGLGPVLPSTARDLLGRSATVGQVAVDERGAVIGVGDPVRCSGGRVAGLPARLRARLAAPPPPVSEQAAAAGYRFSPRLRRFLEARDRTCVFPGCGRPAGRTDKDHRRPWPAGPTSIANGQCLCRRHHRAKHAVFRVERDDAGVTWWITRGGWRFRRPPRGY